VLLCPIKPVSIGYQKFIGVGFNATCFLPITGKIGKKVFTYFIVNS